jgi:hypothetical protein
MHSAIALLIAIITLLGGPKETAHCSTEQFEDRSYRQTCTSQRFICAAWFDAEEQKFQGFSCEVRR